jgi:hypothetical protein
VLGIGAYIRRPLKTGGVFEEHIRMFCCHLDRWVHETERRGKDQLVAGTRELFDSALGVGTFRHVLKEDRVDLVAESLLHR